MKKTNITILVLIISILLISCKSDQPSKRDLAKADLAEIPEFLEARPGPFKAGHPHPYEASFDMVQLEDELYQLVIKMDLFDGAHFVSPNAVRDFSGKFTLHLDDSDHLALIDKLEESPLSKEVYDPHPFVKGKINWVFVNTKYRQNLVRTTADNFQVKGYIQFTIEPRCTLENIPIIIKYEGGKMRVELFGC